MPQNPYAAQPIDYAAIMRRMAQAARRVGPAAFPLTAPMAALRQGLQEPQPPGMPAPQAPAFAPQAQGPQPFVQPPAQPPVAMPPQPQPRRQPTVSSGAKLPPPGRGAAPDDYRYEDLTAGAEPPQVAGTASGGASGGGGSADLDDAQRILDEYHQGVTGTGGAERGAERMYALAAAMRGVPRAAAPTRRGGGTMAPDWASQLSDALRGGIEGYATYKGLKGEKEREEELERLRQQFLAARRGGAVQLSGPGME